MITHCSQTTKILQIFFWTFLNDCRFLCLCSNRISINNFFFESYNLLTIFPKEIFVEIFAYLVSKSANALLLFSELNCTRICKVLLELVVYARNGMKLQAPMKFGSNFVAKANHCYQLTFKWPIQNQITTRNFIMSSSNYMDHECTIN